MKLLTATSRTQGQRTSDFTFCVEGELVIVGAVLCEQDRQDPDAGCGCGRSFVGLSTSKATTTAVVTDLDFSRDDVAEAIGAYLQRSGRIATQADVDAVTEAAIMLAEGFAADTVLERRLSAFNVRH